jgi:GNAT superfamily N-acetyltransferase
MDRIEIEHFAPGHARRAARLVRTTFDAFVAPDCTEEGCRTFHVFASAARMRERLRNGHFGYLAWAGPTLAGVLVVREPAHLLTLFVDAHHHRRGIARALLLRALQTVRANAVQVSAMTVNASPYAVAAYERLGFEREAPLFLKNGIASVPMRRVLDDAFWTTASQPGPREIACAARHFDGNLHDETDQR